MSSVSFHVKSALLSNCTLSFNFKQSILEEQRFLLDVKKTLKIHRPRILTRSVRFPPFGFATTEIISIFIENTTFY